MGNSCSKAEQLIEQKDLTDETWSQLLEGYLGVEDTDIDAELIYHFDGKAVSGPANSDPLRCRRTGRYLQHKHFQQIVTAGGLSSLPILRFQGASVRTGGQSRCKIHCVFMCV